MISSIKLLGFRAVEYPQLARRVFNEHNKRLAEFNIRAITSSQDTWLTNPSVYCICAIDEFRKKIIGAIRIQIADSINRLPLEDALNQFGVNLRHKINDLQQDGTVAESCGLWCSGEPLVKQLNLSSKLLSFETAMCKYLNVVYCFGFGPNHNLNIFFKAGFRKHQQFPNPFTYPNEKYQSWVLYKTPLDLRENDEETKLKILVNDPHLVYRSEFENDTVLIKYELLNFDFCMAASPKVFCV